MPQLSIVIPAKNEEKRINKTLSTYGSFFASRFHPKDIEIIVVVNDSFDETLKCVDSYSKKYPFIKRINTPYKSGKGGAVSIGFAKAEGDFIGFVDADGSVPPTEIYKLFSFILETPWLDGVIGQRDPRMPVMSLKRHFISRIYNGYVKVLFNLPYTDTQCGVKIFRSAAAKSISTRLVNTGWSFDVNLLLVAKYLNLKILEQPVFWSEKDGSKFSFWEGAFKVPFELFYLKAVEIAHNISDSLTRFFKHQPRPKSKNKKNILIFAWRDIKHPDMGGSEVYVHQIAKRLAKKNNVTLFTSKPGNLSDRDSIDNIEIVRKGGMFTVYYWAFYYYLFYFRKDTDIVIDVENGIPFFTPLFSRKPKLMILHHVHKGQWFKQFSLPLAVVGYFIESVLMPIIYYRTPIVTVSPSSMSELRELGFNDKRIFLAYNSIPPKQGNNVSKSRFPSLLYLGRVRAYKRLEVAIDSLKHILPHYPDAILYIGGTGDHLDNIKAYIKKQGLEHNVMVLGFISERRKWELMKKSWLFLMPSMKEGWGITIIEAASCGTPSIGFNVPGVRDSIKDGVTGKLANSLNEYKNLVNQMIEDKKQRTSMVNNCVHWASYFSWNNSLRVFENIIDHFSNPDTKFMSEKTYPWDLDLPAETVLES